MRSMAAWVNGWDGVKEQWRTGGIHAHVEWTEDESGAVLTPEQWGGEQDVTTSDPSYPIHVVRWALD